MFRAGAVRALYAATRTQIPRQLPAFRTQISSSLLRPSRVAPSAVVQSIRNYSAPSGLSKEEVQGRIMDLLKNFDKVRIIHACFYPDLLLTIEKRSRIHQRYLNSSRQSLTCVLTTGYRLPAPRTSRTILDWTAWIPWKSSWLSRKSSASRSLTRRPMPSTAV